jgi:uncharacterized phiE125 gp8 family phage protein
MRIIRDAAVAPIGLAFAKAFLRVEHSADDALISGLIRAAVNQAEAYLRRSIMVRTYEETLPDFGGYELRLPRPPVRSVDSIRYVAADGTLTTLDPSEYRTDLRSTPAILTPAYGYSWPTTREQSDAVRIRFRAGWISPFDLVEGSPSDLLEVASNWLAAGDEISYYAIGGDAYGGMAHGAGYTVAGVSGNRVTLIDADGAVVQPQFLSGATEATHVLGELPEGVVPAILQILGSLYEHRESVVVGATATRIPGAAEALLSPHRYFGGL